MTTIAWDGEILAVDSLLTSGSIRLGEVQKIFRLQDGRWMAGSGRSARIQQMRIWLDGGPAPVFKDDEEIPSVIVIDSYGNAVEYDDLLTPFEATEIWAGGTGERPALALMLAGMTAIEAVKGAMRVDVYSGGVVRWVRPGLSETVSDG